MTLLSALYVGTVMHRRVRRARTGCATGCSGCCSISTNCRRSRATAACSRTTFNLFSFCNAITATARAMPLREQVEAHLAAAGIDLDGGAIRLLCMPRMLGYGFNPISVYFCHRPRRRARALLYEVHNTFGERHSYFIAVEATAA